MTTTARNKIALGDELRTLENGIKANFTDVQSIIVGGVTYTIPELTAKIDTFIAAQTATVNARNAYHSAVVAETSSNVAARAFRGQVQGYAIARYGKGNPILAQFSFTPTQPKKTTVAIKAMVVLKVKATRKARNTMSAKRKALIKGSVDPSIAAALMSELTQVSPPPGMTQAPMVAIAPTAAAASSTGAAGGTPASVASTPGHAG